MNIGKSIVQNNGNSHSKTLQQRIVMYARNISTQWFFSIKELKMKICLRSLIET